VLMVVSDRRAWDCATEKFDACTVTSDLESDAVLSWLVGSFGIDDDASSVGAISDAAVGPDAATVAFGSNDSASCLGGAISEVDKPVSSVVPLTDVSTSGACVGGDGVASCISEIAEVVSSVAAPCGVVEFGAVAASDVVACCEVGFSKTDGGVSAVDFTARGVALGLAAVPAAGEEDRSVSSGLDDGAALAVKGLGLGTGIGAAGVGLAETAACCAG
jgi:hypothetical protein